MGNMGEPLRTYDEPNDKFDDETQVSKDHFAYRAEQDIDLTLN